MNNDLIEQKIESLRRALVRIRQACPEKLDKLQADLDAQDIVTLNLTRAVQLCVDIAAHLLSAREVAPPATMGGAFDGLVDTGVISQALADRMKKAVGFRNLAVHNYHAINWAIVESIVKERLGDFEAFANAVLISPDT